MALHIRGLAVEFGTGLNGEARAAARNHAEAHVGHEKGIAAEEGTVPEAHSLAGKDRLAGSLDAVRVSHSLTPSIPTCSVALLRWRSRT